MLTSVVFAKFIDQSHSDGHMSALVPFRSWGHKTLERKAADAMIART